MCEKCRIYLYDYFQQPIDKENPLYSFVNHKQLQKNRETLVDLAYHLLFKTIPYARFQDAHSQVENYCTFAYKPETPYKQYEILYTFLSRETKFRNEVKQMEGLLLDCQFLRIPKTDKTCQLLHRWLSFLLGSLYQDMDLLHKQHSGKVPVDINMGHPGRPDTSPKYKKEEDPKPIVVDDDDLYT